jgi:hypothetical protein
MTDIVGWLQALLAPLGTLGLFIIIFLFFYIDAILFPTLPEIFTLLVFSDNPTSGLFAVEILVTILAAEVLGLTTLYLIVKHVAMPKKIEMALARYTKFLFVKDEKIILINRIAPVLPFMGAFAAVCHWDFRRCIYYTLLGGVIKYSFILISSAAFYAYLKSGDAFLVSVALVLSIIAVSIILSYTRKDKILGPKTEGGEAVCHPKEK